MKAMSYNRPSGGSGDVPFQPQNYLIPKQSTKGEDKGVFELMSLLPLLEVERQTYFLKVVLVVFCPTLFILLTSLFS